ncbi:hypothetical protein BABINDRAFT_160916 [Babjeviella inositovora NRRL Y-12698]|uniref:Nodulin-like domain-containing protein n=1 Tax=Babjeviella inositovora NRRL Y-12698 TaxID=984486 RepID=A0A1E3QSK8_9ASCO|nr:uncharacterized protein BABINDRAFT_160916 [Babjeviella inositovora NRRL Y-12698]ODQ80679.1 hypothetical protein BABINDRAFT_160916 [Babjeviella inositovora NRRL Y-12698]
MPRLQSRYSSLAASAVVSLAAGTPYLYGVFAPQLVKQLGLAASDSATFALASNIGSGLGGLPGGILIDTKGPQLAIIVGSICIFTGYYSIYYCYTHVYASLWLISAAMASVGFGSVTGFYACVKTCATNFPDYKGTAGAFPVSAYGLLALIFSSISAMYFGNNTGGFLRFLALLCGSTVFSGVFFVKFYHLSDEEAPLIRPVRTLRTPSSSSVFSNTDSVASTRTFSLRNSMVFFGVGKRDPLHRSESSAEITRTVKDDQAFASRSSAVDTLKVLFSSRVFLVHYIVMALIASIGQMYIYSVGFVVTAQINNPHNRSATTQEAAQAIQVSLISICSFLGRLTSGPISDFLVHKMHAQRHWLVIAATVLLSVGQLLATRLDSIDSLWMVSSPVGLAYGFLMGVYPAIMADLFGTAGLSTTWGLICTGPLALLFVLSSYFGVIYDRNSVVDPEVGKICRAGVACYKDAFVTTEGLCVVIFVITLGLIYYQRIQ